MEYPQEVVSACEEINDILAAEYRDEICEPDTDLDWLMTRFGWYANWKEISVHELCRKLYYTAVVETFKNIAKSSKETFCAKYVDGSEFNTFEEAWNAGENAVKSAI